MDATWQRLGDAAGARGVGVSRVRVAPGKLPTPPHSHGASEELYFVLAGSGLAWQDDAVHEVRPRDCVIHRADEHEHTFVAGPEGLEYLVFGTRHATEIGWLPRSRAIRIGWPWVEGRDDDPWDTEAEAATLAHVDPTPRPREHPQRRRGRARGERRDDDGSARHPRALGAGGVALGDARSGPARLAPALPFRGGRGLRDPGGGRDARAPAVSRPRGARREERGDRAAAGPPDRPSPGNAASPIRSWPAPTG